MVRIGRRIQFTGSRETLSERILQAIERVPPSEPINFTFTSNNMMNIYGDSNDLLALKSYLEGKGFTFTIGLDAPPEDNTTPTEPPINYDPAILKQATKNIIQLKIDDLETALQTEYTTLGGTGTIPEIDWKHYRWAL